MSQVSDFNFDGWIPLEVYCEKYGEKKVNVLARVSDGIWPRGEMFAAPDGTMGYVHEQRVLEWRERTGRATQPDQTEPQND